MEFSPPSRHSIPLRSKYSPQHSFLKHFQFMFLPYCQRGLFPTVKIESILSRTRVGSVTNNSTRVRIGYRIYSLWRFTAAHITITVNSIALVAPWIPLTELYCTDVSLRELTAEH
jgi:hypothetical protein